MTDRFSGETLRKAYSYLMIATVGDWFCFIYWWDNITILTLAKSIFVLSIILSVVALWILKNKQEVPRAERNHQPFDYVGMFIFGCLLLR